MDEVQRVGEDPDRAGRMSHFLYLCAVSASGDQVQSAGLAAAPSSGMVDNAIGHDVATGCIFIRSRQATS